MALTDLTDLDTAKQHIPNVQDGDEPLVQTLITAISKAIKKYCKRDFTSTAYDELYSGDGDRRLMLRQYPIQQVTSVRYRPVTVLKIINNATTQNQQARVSVNSTGIVLFRNASGVASTDATCLFATYPTLISCANYLNTLGNGWSAQVVGDSNDYSSWPSQDLYVAPSYGDGTWGQGALTARGTNAELKMHTLEL